MNQGKGGGEGEEKGVKGKTEHGYFKKLGTECTKSVVHDPGLQPRRSKGFCVAALTQ